MNFFAVLFALLIEQLKPLPRSNVVHDALTSWMRWTGRNFDADMFDPTWDSQGRLVTTTTQQRSSLWRFTPIAN